MEKINNLIKKLGKNEYNFERDDLMKDTASILGDIKDDQTLVFLDKEDKEEIVELGVITHQNPNALDELFRKIRFKGNLNSRVGFLDFEDDDFVGLVKYRDTLILIANREYVSPRLLIRGLCNIVAIILNPNENIGINNYYFSPISASNFKLTGLNAKILSAVPNLVLDKMNYHGGSYIYSTSNLKITYDDNQNTSYFSYLQKYKAEPLYEVIEEICKFNPELAIPASFINAKVFSEFTDRGLVKRLSSFEEKKERWEKLKSDGWKVQIDDFTPMDLSFISVDYNGKSSSVFPDLVVDEDRFVFDWETEVDEEKKKLHIYPKYQLKGKYLLYTSDADFEKNEVFKQLDPFQKEIALIARSIFGNFIPQFPEDERKDYFSALTMLQTSQIMEDENNKRRIPGISENITFMPDFADYYDSISQPDVAFQVKKLKGPAK